MVFKKRSSVIFIKYVVITEVPLERPLRNTLKSEQWVIVITFDILVFSNFRNLLQIYNSESNTNILYQYMDYLTRKLLLTRVKVKEIIKKYQSLTQTIKVSTKLSHQKSGNLKNMDLTEKLRKRG